MILKLAALLSILVTSLAGGMFWGPWVALTISIRTFTPEVFLAIFDRLARNIGTVMTFLLPLALVTMVPVLFLAYPRHPATFYLTLAGFGLYVVALLVTAWVEVPLVKRMGQWTMSTLPPGWEQVRDWWSAFHIIRVVATVVGLAMIVAGGLAI